MVGVVGALGFLGARQPVTAPVVPKPPGFVKVSPKPAPDADVTVEVVGTVARPGLYTLPEGSRVVDALKAAGGPLPRTDMDAWNRAAKLKDGAQLRFARRSPTPIAMPAPRRIARRSPRGLSGSVGSVGSVAPLAVAVPDEYAGAPVGNLPSALTSPSAASKPRSSRKAPPAGPVSLNTGSQAELETLPGVGPSLAGKILAYRREKGGFSSIDELDAVPGVGPATLARLRPYLTL